MSYYTDAKSTQWTSSYHTALNSQNLPISSGLESHKNELFFFTGLIKVIERLTFDPRDTDSKHPSTRSLLPRLEYALRVNKTELGNAEWSRDLSSYPAYVADRNAREGLLPLQGSLQATKGRTPHRVVNQMPARTLPLLRRSFRHTSSNLARRLNPSDIISSDSEPFQSRDVRRLTAQREKKRLQSIQFSAQEVERLGFGSEQQPANHPRSIKRFVTNPPQEIPEKDFWDSDAYMPKPTDPSLTLVDQKGAIEISPDAPRSAGLAALVKHTSKSPQTDIKPKSSIPLSLCGSKKALSGPGSLEWRPFTYKELTWVEMMDRSLKLEGCSSQEIGRRFARRFGMKLPDNWESMAKEMFLYPIYYKKAYMGWYPEEVGWKRRVVGLPRLRETEQGRLGLSRGCIPLSTKEYSSATPWHSQDSSDLEGMTLSYNSLSKVSEN